MAKESIASQHIYTHEDASGMAWRFDGSGPVSPLANLVIREIEDMKRTVEDIKRTHGIERERVPANDGVIDYPALKARIPVCDRTLREWIRKGIIPSVRLPGARRRLFFWKDVEAALRRNTVPVP
jgi:hypothetical protein